MSTLSLILLICYFVNIVAGLILCGIFGDDLSEKLCRITPIIIITGLGFWVVYGIYQLIRLPKILQEKKIEKEKQELRKIKKIVMNYIIHNNLNNCLKSLLFDCKNIYSELNKAKYKDINELYNYKFEKIYISTINYIIELDKQYGQVVLNQNTDQIIETLTSLKEYLESELETYEREYLKLTNKDQIIVKKALDELNKKLKIFTEFNNKY